MYTRQYYYNILLCMLIAHIVSRCSYTISLQFFRFRFFFPRVIIFRIVTCTRINCSTKNASRLNSSLPEFVTIFDATKKKQSVPRFTSMAFFFSISSTSCVHVIFIFHLEIIHSSSVVLYEIKYQNTS